MTLDAAAAIAHLYIGLWPRASLPGPKARPARGAASFPIAGAARSMDRDCGGHNCAKPSSPSAFSLAERLQRSRSSSQNDADARLGNPAAI
jgi:hypothetical protein